MSVDPYRKARHQAEVALFHHYLDRIAEVTLLRHYLDWIGDEVGCQQGASPQQVLEAAQRLRGEVARLRGYPSDPPGSLTAFRERGW